MNCNLTKEEHKKGMRCRSFDCQNCKDYCDKSGRFPISPSCPEIKKGNELEEYLLDIGIGGSVTTITTYAKNKNEANGAIELACSLIIKNGACAGKTK